MVNNVPGGAEKLKAATQQPKMVPESDLLALKHRAEKAEAEATKVAKELAELKAKEDEVKFATAAEDTDSVKALKKSLLDEYKALRQSQQALSAEKKELDEKALVTKRAELAAKYGVDASVVGNAVDEEEAELFALRHLAQNPRKEDPKKPSFDRGTPGGTPSATPLTPTQKIAEGLRRGEIKGTGSS